MVDHLVGSALGAPASADLNAAAIIDVLGSRRAIVYLDNCEHLLGACARLVTALLAGCPGLHVLTSSRRVVDLPGEHVFAMPPLTTADAVALFLARAAVADPETVLGPSDVDSVADLCATLDRLPLAIELAAAQIGNLAPLEIERSLRRDFGLMSVSADAESQGLSSMEACIRWSYELCSPEEQLLWARLSVFGGGFSRADARAACHSDGLQAEQVGRALDGLVGQCLLEPEGDGAEDRYRILEVIRQFGAARLVDSGELAVWRRRHRDHYLDLAEQFDRAWIGPDQAAWMTRFRLEHVNLRLAFDFSVADPVEAPFAMRMCTVLEHYFASTGGGGEAVHWLSLALAHGTGTARERASALRVGCFVAVLLPDLDTAAAWYRELADLSVGSEDEWIAAYALYGGAVLRTWQGDADTGARLAGAGIELLHRLEDVSREANLHFLRGMMLDWIDRPSAAAHAYTRCLELTEPRGEKWLSSYAAWGLGIDALLADDLDRATDFERQALEVKVGFGDQLGIGLAIEALAWIAAEQERGPDAAVLIGAAETIWSVTGMAVAAMPYLTRRRELGISQTRALLGPDRYGELVHDGRELPQADAVAVALGLPGTGTE